MKILCVCSAGNSRSAATKIIINNQYDRNRYEAIAVGVDLNSSETLAMLSHWADKILLAQPLMAGHFPIEDRNKIDEGFTLGEDVWGNPLNEDLLAKVKEQLVKIGLP